MRLMVAAIGAAFGLTGAAVAQPTRPVEVMVVGTYHMANPGRDIHNVKADDVLKPQRQRELDALSAALAEFRPTKIVVERVAKTPALLDHRYAEFTPAELGKNRDERVQVAYRLAHRLGHKTVYAIDENPGPGEPDYFPFGKVVAWAKANNAQARVDAIMAEGASAVKRIEEAQAKGSIADVLIGLNSPEQTNRDQGLYYTILSIGDTDAQPGADLNAMWYLRNAKIFAKLMTVAKPGDRVLVVYGAGHNYWLRHFAAHSPGYVNVDPAPYLRKAAAADR